MTPIVGEGGLFLFMEPTSPKGHDIARRGTPDVRARAVRAASDAPRDRCVLFELQVAEARCNGYGDVVLPEPRLWRAPDPSP